MSTSGLDSLVNTPKTSHFKKELIKCHRKLHFQDKKIRNLKKQNKRLIKANSSLKEIVQDLRKKRLIDDSLYNDIETVANSNDECIMKILTAKKRKPFSSYPPALKKFALTLHFYSTAAYQYLRRIFNKSLPHPSTLFRWYKNVKAEPGFTDEAFNRLTDKSKQSSEPLICSLIADEMSIRQQRIWTGTKYEGLVDMGIGMDTSDQKASQAFVLLVVSLTQGWTLPIAYFFIQSLTGEMKANIINIALHKCHEAGVKIVSLTFDGCKSNINCMKFLGCYIDNHENMNTTFQHPNGDYKIAIFLDVCHMVKLVRNLLESKKEFYGESDAVIKWSLILQLHNLQEENSLHLANKLTLRHVQFRNEIMKVKLATQLLSNSVAKAIEFCDKELKLTKFEHSEATVKFLKLINDIFDILNSRNLKDYGLKKPLDSKNVTEVMSLCHQAKTYLLSLSTKVAYKKTIRVNRESRTVIEFRQVPLHKCQANTGIVGLLVCINSLEYLYKSLVESKAVSYLMTFKFSQDHVELFFGKIRSLGGFNNNPNARQFKSAYKKMLSHLELSSKFTGNCLPLENLPILQGNLQNINKSSLSYRHEEVDEETISKAFIKKRLNEESSEDKYNSNCDQLAQTIDETHNDEIKNQIVGYISGFVVYQLLKKLHCDDCKNILLATQKEWFHKLVDLKDMGGLCYASKDVFVINTETENIIRHYIKLSGGKFMLKMYSKAFLTTKVIQSLLNINIFTQIDGHTKDQFHHIYDLTKVIIEKYVDIRLHYICKRDTLEKKTKSKRQVFNKLNLFQGT